LRAAVYPGEIMEKPDNSGSVQHVGMVQKVDTNSVVVKILPESACAGCHAEGYCSLSRQDEKTVSVNGNYNVSEGDLVTVVMKESLGYNALLLGYIVPFIVLLSGLILFVSLSVPELIAGLLSIATLVPYYLTIYFFRKRISKKFTFTLKT
jgi:positive regulator of sigma E activity